MDNSWSLEGTDMQEVYKTLDALPLAVKGNAIRAVHRKAGQMIRNELLSNAPTNSEEFKKEIKVKSDKYNKSGIIVGSFHFTTNWFEFGTVQRTKKSGASTGAIQPKPFVEKSFKNVVDRVNQFVITNYSNLINKYLESYLKRQNKKLTKL